MASRTVLVYNSSISLDFIETFTYRYSRDVFNRLRLSRLLEEARRLVTPRVPVYISDVDALMMQYFDNGRRRRFIGFEFKNMRRDVALKGGYVKVNGKQYELHYYFSRMAEFDFYYLVRAGREYFLWNVARAPVEFRWLGDKDKGTYDYYALVPRDFVAQIPEEELPQYLGDMIFRR
uniref:Uncharacterized protein n=1 Tax=Pyrococcus abyssi TaxID=29292 RepID=A0A5J6XUR9_PYRAY|nr:hypothetical protein [Pyrococcus abyssi]QFN51298.1 hypothetical protein [Pyrococcus abyssi]